MRSGAGGLSRAANTTAGSRYRKLTRSPIILLKFRPCDTQVELNNFCTATHSSNIFAKYSIYVPIYLPRKVRFLGLTEKVCSRRKRLVVSADPAEFEKLNSLTSRNLEMANFATSGGIVKITTIFTCCAITGYQYRPTVARFRAPTFGLASLTLFGNPLRECRSRFTTSRWW